MAKKAEKAKKVTKYMATNAIQFKEWYNENTPFYGELSDGKSVELDITKKPFINLLKSNIIKEV